MTVGRGGSHHSPGHALDGHAPPGHGDVDEEGGRGQAGAVGLQQVHVAVPCRGGGEHSKITQNLGVTGPKGDHSEGLTDSRANCENDNIAVPPCIQVKK